MNPEPIDAGRLALRALRLLDDGRRAAEKTWRGWTSAGKPKDAGPPAYRREPPDVW